MCLFFLHLDSITAAFSSQFVYLSSQKRALMCYMNIPYLLLHLQHVCWETP